MIDFKEITSPEIWELFARDFLADVGFKIVSSPDRGADEGKDFIVSETISGLASDHKLLSMVSCKHNAVSDKSVNESDESNILERMKAFGADCFIGVYSTLPSAGLNTRLNRLVERGEIISYKIYDKKLIEKRLLFDFHSMLLQRYFPQSYDNIKPIHCVVDEYVPLPCEVCGADLLKKSITKECSGNVVSVEDRDGVGIIKVYCACKDEKCDSLLEARYNKAKLLTGWCDLQDLLIPGRFLQHVLGVANSIRSGQRVYSDAAWEEQKNILISISQRVLRLTTKRERERFLDLLRSDY
ncbi:hypothetical protein [Fundidesulfovibrio soli]|uniref:hypothetical protein n=1 Tax=Fundidesulfovibrio soli TaxID=2922716 RepID=UPI001FAF7E9E|nr:hypothetical protein [Fundidesulfovibrio soli]